VSRKDDDRRWVRKNVFGNRLEVPDWARPHVLNAQGKPLFPGCAAHELNTPGCPQCDEIYIEGGTMAAFINAEQAADDFQSRRSKELRDDTRTPARRFADDIHGNRPLLKREFYAEVRRRPAHSFNPGQLEDARTNSRKAITRKSRG
jgi:hypothetical protein